MDSMITIRQIKRAVAAHFGVDDLDLRSRRRTVARPRQVAMALARDLMSLSYPEIARAFGGMDHTTVMYAVRRIAELRREDIDLDVAVRMILGGLRRDALLLPPAVTGEAGALSEMG